MSNLLLGIHIIFPIFLAIGLGYWAKEKNYIDENFVSKATWVVFYMALPLKLFCDIKNTKIESLHPKFVLYVLFGTLFVFVASWILARMFIRDNLELSAFVHCCFRGNFLYIGLPILEGIYQNPSLELVVILTAFGITLYNILGTVILAFYTDKGNFQLKKFLVKIIQNPMIVAIVLGGVCNQLQIPVYAGIESCFLLLGKMATPLSLLVIGGSLNFSRSGKKFLSIFMGAFTKVALVPLVMVPIGVYLGLNNVELVTSYVFWSTPCAVNCFIMTKQMGSDADMAGKIVTLSFLLAVVSYPVGIALLKIFQIL